MTLSHSTSILGPLARCVSTSQVKKVQALLKKEGTSSQLSRPSKTFEQNTDKHTPALIPGQTPRSGYGIGAGGTNTERGDNFLLGS